MEPFDLAAVTSQVIAARQHEVDHRNLALHAALGPAPAAGSPRLAGCLAVNLIDNARRHSLPGGQFHVTTETRDSRAVLSVANTGSAVPAGALDQLFQPFQRLAADRTTRASASSLTIVQAIADAHGASITARPQPEGGLLVEVTFPDPGPQAVSPTHETWDSRAPQPKPPPRSQRTPAQ